MQKEKILYFYFLLLPDLAIVAAAADDNMLRMFAYSFTKHFRRRLLTDIHKNFRHDIALVRTEKASCRFFLVPFIK